MSKRVKIYISALLFEEEGQWVAQGIEVDINGQGETPYEAYRGLYNCATVHAMSDQQEGRKLFEGIHPAPSKFSEEFFAAKRGKSNKSIPAVLLLEFMGSDSDE